MPELISSLSPGNPSKMPGELKVLLHHIYEFKKGIRPLILFTCHQMYEGQVIQKLESQHIAYLRQKAGKRTVNLFFGRPECIQTIRFLADKPLYSLTPEEDFILGALLGYDICRQCERYCLKKETAKKGKRETSSQDF